MRRESWVLAGGFAALALTVAVVWQLAHRAPAPRLVDVGPRLVSNQTSQPIALYGERFRRGMRLRLSAPFARELPVTVVDARHAYARLPADLAIAPDVAQVSVTLSVVGQREPGVPLALVNDAAYPDWTQLVAAGGALWAASSTTDALARVDPRTGEVRHLPGGDGPSALAAWTDSGGRPLLAVAHAWSPELWVLDARTGERTRTLPAPSYASGLVVDARRNLALVAEVVRDSVVAVGLDDGKERWRAEVMPNPKPLALAGDVLLVGAQGSGDVQALSLDDGHVVSTLAPGPGTSILGGHTEPHGKDVMGGKAPRALVWSAALRRAFVTSIGPNVGPNPEHMEVSMNGGVGVLDVGAGRFDRHLAFGWGVPEGMALDDARGRLYVADGATGTLRALDARALTGGEESARRSVIWSLEVPPPADFPLVRPAADLGVNGRSSVALHSGPRAPVLLDGRLFVLNRFTATVAEVDGADGTAPRIVRQLSLDRVTGQQERRLGQVLYHADVGRTAMTCDACHLEGHGEGILFEKTHPLRIYRSPTVRASRESPPYFTPASTRSLSETARVVGARNRYFNPPTDDAEVKRLELWSGTVTTLPNPWVGPDGAPPTSIALPGGGTGNARAGLALFEGKADCVRCHPPPHFTTDQDAATRGRFLDVGTPHLFPLRPEHQEDFFRGVGVPALVGAWDVFPMLTTGLAGFSVDGGRARVSSRVPLRTMIEKFSAPPHGNAAALDVREKNDLLAYLLTL